MPTIFVFARHGQTAWNREGRCQGHADIPLDDVGIEQARALAQELAGMRIDAIYASDLARAHETARIVAAARQASVAIARGLREIDVGSWSGLTGAEIDARFPGAQYHDGETPDEHRERVVAAIHSIAAAHPDEHVLVVSHGGSLESLRRHAGVACAPLANCAWFSMIYDAGGFREP